VLVYSALDRLIECCGPHQPWVGVPTGKLDAIDEYAPFDVVLMDIDIPAESRRQEASHA
jgi:hypothetical protein